MTSPRKALPRAACAVALVLACAALSPAQAEEADATAAIAPAADVWTPAWYGDIPEGDGPESGQMPPYAGDLPIEFYEAPDYCERDKRQVRAVVGGVYASGILVVEIYNKDPDQFLERSGVVRRARIPAEDGPQTVCLTTDAEGPLAVAVYHDVNGNRDFDKNFIGIPKEPIGLSMNPKLRLAKPKHRRSAFEISETGVDLWIELKKY